MSGPIDSLTIRGFLSIRNLERLKLGPLNVLIGANGSGKSNFITFFRMLNALAENRLDDWVKLQGGANRILTFGVRETERIESVIGTSAAKYSFDFIPTADNKLLGVYGTVYSVGSEVGDLTTKPLTSDSLAGIIRDQIMFRRIYHFHDTDNRASVKFPGEPQDNEYLRPDASNLAAFLYKLRHKHPDSYAQIRSAVQQVAPFFDDFILDPEREPGHLPEITLLWKQKYNDYPFLPSQLSDGTLRFICLATALLQPEPPPTILIDEPELGLHPYALAVLGALVHIAARRTQVIIATQSVPLLNEFSVDDLIVVEQEKGTSIFKRLSEADLDLWLEEYSIGELWQKNVIGGRP